jgi:hypothetical protein
MTVHIDRQGLWHLIRFCSLRLGDGSGERSLPTEASDGALGGSERAGRSAVTSGTQLVGGEPAVQGTARAGGGAPASSTALTAATVCTFPHRSLPEFFPGPTLGSQKVISVA